MVSPDFRDAAGGLFYEWTDKGGQTHSFTNCQPADPETIKIAECFGKEVAKLSDSADARTYASIAIPRQHVYLGAYSGPMTDFRGCYIHPDAIVLWMCQDGFTCKYAIDAGNWSATLGCYSNDASLLYHEAWHKAISHGKQEKPGQYATQDDYIKPLQKAWDAAMSSLFGADESAMCCEDGHKWQMEKKIDRVACKCKVHRDTGAFKR
jgi:hypothetical protein